MAADAVSASYGSVRGRLDTGDIVLFSGKGHVSQGIRWLTRSKFSHVGMVVKLAESSRIAIYESIDLADLEDLDSDEVKKGVRTVFLSERVEEYRGEVVVRHLRGVERDDHLRRTIEHFREEMRGKPYEQSRIELLKAAYDGPFGENEENLSSLFCSELVAEAYQRLKILGTNSPSNEYTPADFSEKHSHRLDWLRGELGPEISIERG